MAKKRVIEFTEDEIRGYLAKRHTLATLGKATSNMTVKQMNQVIEMADYLLAELA